MKVCKECKKGKDETEYYVYKTGYLFPYCKPCARARSRVQSKEYYSNNSKKVTARTGKWTKANKAKMRPWYAEYAKNRRNNDLHFRVAHNLRKQISNRIAGLKREVKYTKPKSVLKTIGCDINALVLHIESKWTQGMNWENYGSGSGKWEIDHIVSLIHFKLPDQMDEANHYTNLQPIWSIYNKHKSTRLNYKIPKSVPHLK